MVARSMKKANLHVKNCSVYWGTQEIKFWHDKTRSKGLTEYLSCKKFYGHTAQVIALGKQTNQQSPTKQQNQAIEILLQLWVVLNCFAALAKCTLVFLHRINMKKNVHNSFHLFLNLWAGIGIWSVCFVWQCRKQLLTAETHYT